MTEPAKLKSLSNRFRQRALHPGIDPENKQVATQAPNHADDWTVIVHLIQAGPEELHHILMSAPCTAQITHQQCETAATTLCAVC